MEKCKSIQHEHYSLSAALARLVGLRCADFARKIDDWRRSSWNVAFVYWNRFGYHNANFRHVGGKIWLQKSFDICRNFICAVAVLPVRVFKFRSDNSNAFLFVAMMGCIDVVVNIQVVIVEKFTKKRLMSGFHALWSVGGFIGAGLFGVWVGFFGFSPIFSTAVATLIMLAVTIKFSKYLLSEGGEKSDSLVAIPRGAIIFIGIISFISFLTEGAVLDWSGVFLTTVKNFDISLAGVGFSIFSAAMLIMRLTGDKLVQAVGKD